MSLIKKFQILFNNETRNQNRVDESVKIAEEFAIEFHTWYSSIIDRVGILEYKKRFMNKTTEQLLEIFKQEKEIESINKMYSRLKTKSSIITGTKCISCSSELWLKDEDAGSEMEIQRKCKKCLKDKRNE